MKNYTQIQDIVQPFLMICFTAVLFAMTATSVHAANSVTLTINNGSSAAITNGTAVTLRWQVTGTVRDCSINNGVGAIPNTELPIGSRTHVPPPNNKTTYRMTCTGGSDSVVVSIRPEISLSIDPAQPIIMAVSQSARVNGVTWSTTYATRCDDRIRIIPIDGWSQAGLDASWTINRQISGSLVDTKWLRGDARIRLTCYNDVNGQSTTQELIVRPTRTEPAPDPAVQITAQPKAGPSHGSANLANVTLHPPTGLGWVQVRTTAQNAGWCERWITFGSGSGDQWGVATIQGSAYVWHNDKMTMDQVYGIWETTTFNIECRQTRNDTSGNLNRATASVTVPYNPPAGSLPNPVITVSGDRTETNRDPLTGLSSPNPYISLTTSNVNACFFRALRANGSSYSLPGWTDNVRSTLSVGRNITISETTVFEARCRTADGREVTDQHRVELINPGALPAPVVTFTASDSAVNPEADGVGRVELSWSATNATYCEVNADPATGSDYTLPNTWPSHTGTYEVYDDTTFTAVCGRAGDSLTDSESAVVNLNAGTEIIDDAATVAAGECLSSGTPRPTEPWEMVGPGGQCMNAVDLHAGAPSISLAAATTDPATGEYDSVNVLSLIQNHGPGAVPNGESLSYVSYIEIVGRPDVVSPTNYHSNGIAAPAVSSYTESPTLSHTFNNLPFGTHEFCSRVNLDGSPNFPERVVDPANNTACTTVTLPVPTPTMTLTSDRVLIRSGQSATLTWNVPVTYALSCTVSGPGMTTQSFSTPGSTSGSLTTSTLTTSSRFTLTCTEPTTSTSFPPVTIAVDVVPEFEEI